MQRLYNYLSPELSAIVRGLPEEIKKSSCEMRIRKGGALSVTTYTKNLFVSPLGKITSKISEAYICNENDIVSVVARLTENSVYRYMSTINSGYIVTREGIRTGIAGECVYSSGKISSVTSYSSLNIRLPHDIENVGDKILEFIKDNPHTSILIYSPAGYGKTTVIRSVAKGIAKGKLFLPQRVSVIDERGEILPAGAEGLVDRFVGYTKPDGIEIAVRLFSPQYVICDEIGLSDDTRAILSVQNSGVPFIATTHGKTLDEILRRPNIRELINNGVFGAFARLDRTDGFCTTEFEVLSL